MKAIVEAANYCSERKIRKLVIESDSLLMVNIINRSWKVPWELQEYYDELQQALVEIAVTVQHIFREGNKMVDYMAI
ncbi:hypothetical protein KY290_017446 [Solanum tuberosum]|uniref:RNase H type-1 domain-containing protein n=1 Tax=Solanum tuberosum TaxID=4113 RepID=A0ABQ7VBA5_SOLTU|nr:hypothetical protein KY290_017446 [Solanum tuberosum]